MILYRKKYIFGFVFIFFTSFIYGKSRLSYANFEGEPFTISCYPLINPLFAPDWNDISALMPAFNSTHLVNLPPLANAGVDTILMLPTDKLTLRGCNSSDPEMAALSYKWLKIQGPGAFLITDDSSCSIKVNGMVEGTYSFELTVTDTAGSTDKDTVVITVNSVYSPNWPPQYSPLSNKSYKIVVIGSSTAYGIGADPIDSSWVNKFGTYLLQQNSQVSLVNLAVPGYDSYNVCPTGTSVPANWPFLVDTIRNITGALSLKPDAIILNLPSNDIYQGIPFSEITLNYERIQAAADSLHIPIWMTTTQPRNMAVPKQLLQMELRDWIMNRFGKKAVDFWSTISNPDGTVHPYFSVGDDIHVNNAGHHVLFTRIVEEKIWDTICIKKNVCPIAKAGKDTIIENYPAVLTLDGSASYDSDGTLFSYKWRLINASTGILTNTNTANPVFATDSAMDYSIELELTDNLGGITKDTILISVVPAATLTYTFTGNGYWNVASNWKNNFIPPAILSGNALIIIDPREPGECVLNISQKIANGAVLRVMENKKFRIEGNLELLRLP